MMRKAKMKDDDLLDQKKLGDFLDKVYKMADKLFGTDDDGDSRVQIIVVDRTRFWPMHYFPISYDHKVTTIGELEKINDDRMTNLAMAIEQVKVHLKTRGYEEKRIEREAAVERDKKGVRS